MINQVRRRRTSLECNKLRYRNDPVFRAKHKRQATEWAKRLYQTDPTFRTKRRNYSRIHTHRMKEAVMEKYGGACTCCGETYMGFLVMDHVNGDGAIERRRLKENGGSPMYRRLSKMPHQGSGRPE